MTDRPADKDDEASAPADEASASADEASVPADEASASADEASAPADEASASADEASAPADEASASADEASALADEASASADEASAPADEASASADEAQVHNAEQHAQIEQYVANGDEPRVHVPGIRELPLVALRETVIFPEMIVPLQVGRDKSVAALNAAVASNGPIALVTQRQAEREEIEDPSELYTTGTLAKIAQVVQLQDGTVRAIVQGQSRLRVVGFAQTSPYIVVKV
jgi:ATP-dependent Lon protease